MQNYPIRWIPPVDQSPKSTWVGQQNNIVAASRVPSQTCLNPYGAYNCPITLCSCCSGPKCSCNKNIHTPWKRRYVNIKWNQY